MLPVEQPFKTYTGLDGKPLDNGYVYFGQPNQNPITAPVTVYWDAAGTIPAAQPLRTVNGYIMRGGTPANVFFDGAYSVLVQDSKFRQVFSSQTSDGFSIASAVRSLSASLSASFGSSLIGFIQGGDGAILRTVQDKLFEISISVEDFGASPNNTAAQNDVAFAKACAAITAAGGGRLLIPPKTYKVCHQVRNAGGAYGNTDAIVIHDCPRPVKIEGYGAKLVMPDGQYFGSFDPATGNAYTPPALPFWNNAYAGHPGRFIYAYNNKSVLICGLELDGNNTNYVVGGQYGDTGYQVIGNGIELDNNDFARVLDVNPHNCGLDGIDIKCNGLVESSAAKPVVIQNVRSEYNVRQGLSHEGGIECDIIDSQFNHTGRAINVNTGTKMYSSPGAGIDIEPIGSTISRNIRLRGVECVNNVGYGLASDNGDAAFIRLDDCLLWGTTNYAVKPTHPYTEFHHCRVIGRWIGPFTTDQRSATKFYNCSFSDTPWQDGNVAGKNDGGYLVNTGSAKGVLYRDCNFTANYQKLGDMRDSIIERCTFLQIYGGLADKSDVADFRGATLRDVQIIDGVTVPSANGYYVQTDNAQTIQGRCEITYNGAANYLKWFTWDPSAGGFQGIFGTQATSLMLATRQLVLLKNYGANNYSSNIKIISGTTAPTFGTWSQGDICENSAPAVGLPKKWKCTVAGSPGTWVSEGNL